MVLKSHKHIDADIPRLGYGHVTPLTSTGKLFCILYSVLGIPFTLIFLTASVQRLLEPTVNVLAFFFRRLGSRYSYSMRRFEGAQTFAKLFCRENTANRELSKS